MLTLTVRIGGAGRSIVRAAAPRRAAACACIQGHRDHGHRDKRMTGWGGWLWRGEAWVLLRVLLMVLLGTMVDRGAVARDAVPGQVIYQGAGREEGERTVDVALLLAIDASASMSSDLLEFQLAGHAVAFRHPAVARALASGTHGAIAVALAVWSNPNSLHVVVPWTVLSSAADAATFAATIEQAPRPAEGGSTAIGAAIADAVAEFTRLPSSGIRPARLVLDLVSNGFSNAGIHPEEGRGQARAAGVTVNALALLDEYDWLEAYYSENVITGAAAFVTTAEDRDRFTEALLHKLVQEMAYRAPALAG